MKSPSTLALCLLVLATATLVPPGAVAQIGDLGQFHAVPFQGSHPMLVMNPTAREMYSLVIYYHRNGDLDTSEDGCDGNVIPPHGWSDDWEDPDDDNYPIEIISVPTDTGEYDRTGQSNLGVIVSVQHNMRGLAIGPEVFRLPSDDDDRDDLLSCICDELSDDGVADTLFEGVGVDCGVRSAPVALSRSATTPR